MPRQWFIKTKSGHVGPLSSDKLSRLARSGRLLPNMGVSQDGKSWIKAKKIPGLAFSEFKSGDAVDSDAKPTSDEWYVLTKRNMAGPFTHRNLRKLASEGRLPPNVGVSRDKVKWTKAKKIPGLEFPNNSGAKIEQQPARVAPSHAPTLERAAEPFQQLTLSLLIGDEPFGLYSRPRQQTWFGVDPHVPAPALQPRPPSENVWPLFHWPPSTLQQTLAFDDDAAGELEPSRLHQMDFSLLVDDEAFTHYQYAYRQPTLFYVGSQPAAEPPATGSRLSEQFPLFAWPPRETQLQLFVGDSAVTDPVPSHLDIPAQQLKLGLYVGDGEEAEFPLATRTRQLSFFRSESRPPHTLSAVQRSVDLGCPLFHWPPDVVQLRLFDQASEVTAPEDVEREETPVDLQLDAPISSHPIADAPKSGESTPEETQRWLHTQWARARESEYLRRFGPCSHVARPQDAMGAPVDVYIFPPTAQCPITTLVTSGMSNHRMPVPDGPCSARVELILYVDEVKPEYVNLLYFLAQIPLQQNMALRYGSAMSHGNPAQPIFENSPLDGYVFLIPSVNSDFQIHESMKIGDDSLQLLWVVPITGAERNFLAQQGVARFCWLLDEHHHPPAFDPYRHCYIGPASSQAV